LCGQEDVRLIRAHHGQLRGYCTEVIHVPHQRRVRESAPTAITGATTAKYAATAADRGYRLKVAVAGSKAGYATVKRTSLLTAAVSR